MHGTFSLTNINSWQILSRSGYVNTDLWNTFKSQTLMGVRCRLDRSWQHIRCPWWPMTQWFGAANSGGHCCWSNLKHMAASSMVSGDSARPSPGRRFLQSVPSPARAICDVVHPATAGTFDTTPQAASVCSIHIDPLWDWAWSRASILSGYGLIPAVNHGKEHNWSTRCSLQSINWVWAGCHRGKVWSTWPSTLRASGNDVLMPCVMRHFFTLKSSLDVARGAPSMVAHGTHSQHDDPATASGPE